jgi:nucleotide-binding universal stress UspA family protein
MRHFKKILFVSRGITKDSEGLSQALRIAQGNQSDLTVMVLVPEFPREMTAYQEKYQTFIIADMKETIAKITEIPVTIDVQIDQTPAIRIIQNVLKNGHDLVIKDAETPEKHKGFKAIDMDLMRKCPCPVWLCKSAGKDDHLIKIAVAIDPESKEAAATDMSKRMIEISSSMAEKSKGQLHVVSCWDFEIEGFLRHNPWVKSEEEEIQRLLRESKAEHKEALNILIQKSAIENKSYDLHHIHGQAEEEIPALVEKENIDILIMGTVARTGIPGFIIGNTAENILQKVSCSIIALKPPGFVSPVKAY